MERDQPTTITAVVHAPDGVRFIATGPCADQVAAGIIDYVRRRCDDVLWPRAARHVGALIEVRQFYAAIAMYFANVGSRWDEEWLEIACDRADFTSWPKMRSGGLRRLH